MEIKLKMSAAIPRIYRMTFGEDILTGMSSMFDRTLDDSGNSQNMTVDDLTMLENLCYVCHRHADPKQPDNIEAWIEQFELGELQEKCIEVMNLWIESVTSTSTSKKKKDEQ